MNIHTVAPEDLDRFGDLLRILAIGVIAGAVAATTATAADSGRFSYAHQADSATSLAV